jgi:hypothetical protein
VKWCVGYNLFSVTEWQEQNPQEYRRRVQSIATYRVITSFQIETQPPNPTGEPCPF